MLIEVGHDFVLVDLRSQLRFTFTIFVLEALNKRVLELVQAIVHVPDKSLAIGFEREF